MTSMPGAFRQRKTASRHGLTAYADSAAAEKSLSIASAALRMTGRRSFLQTVSVTTAELRLTRFEISSIAHWSGPGRG